MNVNNISIFMGDDIQRSRHLGDEGQKKSSGKMIDASGIFKISDPIADKKKQAQKKAMKVIGDAFAGEREIDDDMERRRQNVHDLNKTIGESNRAIKELEDNRALLREQYGVEQESQEEKDLQLLAKEVDSKVTGSRNRLSLIEVKKIAEIKKNGLSEYQQRSLEVKEAESPYMENLTSANNEVQVENSIITATKIERLKSQSMFNAQKQADSIMDAAADEIMGILITEGKDHIDKEMEEKKEAAEKQEEKKKEQEEKIEVTKEKKEELEEVTEDIIETTEELTSGMADVTSAQQEIKDMMSKMKLLQEDIKGATVDAEV